MILVCIFPDKLDSWSYKKEREISSRFSLMCVYIYIYIYTHTLKLPKNKNKNKNRARVLDRPWTLVTC